MKKKIILLSALVLTSLTGRSQYLEWAKATNGAFSQAYSVTTDAVGNVYTTGYFQGTVDFDPGAATFNLTSAGQGTFIQKLDASGNFVMAKQFTGSNIARSIAVDTAGNIYITGEFQGVCDFDPGAGVFNLTGHGGYDVFLTKLNAAGDFVFAIQIGGTGYDYGESVIVDHSGNVYFGGYFSSTADFDPSPATYTISPVPSTRGNGFVEKLDASGNFVWAKDIGASASVSTARGGSFVTALALDNTDNLLICGTFSDTTDFDPGAGVHTLMSLSSTTIFTNTFVSKLDPSGNYLWAKQIGGIAGCAPTAITTDVSGNILVTGYFENTIDLDPGAGTFYVSCISTTGFQSTHITKLSPAGDFIWGTLTGAPDILQGYGICTDKSGNVYTTGMFRGTADFDPDAATYYLTAGTAGEVYVQKLDSSGHFVSAVQTAVSGIANSIQSTGGIAIDDKRNIYVAGLFQGAYDFDPGTGSVILSSSGADNVFVEKFFQYKFGTGTASGCGSYAIGSTTVTATGTYYDTLTASMGADSIVTLSVTINAMPNAGAITGVADTVCRGATITLADTASGGVWGMVNSHATIAGGVVTGVTTGIDSATYTVTNSCGTARASRAVYVRDCGATEVSGVPVEGIQMQMAPNPNNGLFNLLFASDKHDNAHVVIANIMGQKVKEFTAYANRENIVSLDVPAGIYFLTATDNDARYTGKIVVSK